MPETYRLLTASPDTTGIVAAVTGLIAELGGSISDAVHHSDTASGWFFSRHEVCADSLSLDLEGLREAFQPVAKRFAMDWSLVSSMERKQVALMASKQSHCLSDILHRWQSGELPCDICCIISNHNDLRHMAEWHKIPYYHIPVDPDQKIQAFAEVEAAIAKHKVDTVVLARYMQILPPKLCKEMAGHIINIHHSFLPSFAGARPYHQAAERGVKLIGATCHYVTEVLDAGPIIEQDVVRISHRDNTNDMIRKGKDCEVRVLARGLRSHLQDRIAIHGNKTIVFD